MSLGFKGKIQKKMQEALAEQAYLCYKFGWHQAQVRQEAKLSKNDFCRKIREIIVEGKRISNGIDTDEFFPKEPEGIEGDEKKC